MPWPLRAGVRITAKSVFNLRDEKTKFSELRIFTQSYRAIQEWCLDIAL